MSDKRPKCPNTPKYPCGDCLVCQVPLAASDSPGRPQAPTSPEGPATAPGAHQVDAAGFGSWPSEEEIEAHGNGLWLIRQKGDMAPGQIRSMALGRFGKEEGRTVWWSGGRFSDREHMSAWSFCPIDENGDKLDAAPVLRGEDALGGLAPQGQGGVLVLDAIDLDLLPELLYGVSAQLAVALPPVGQLDVSAANSPMRQANVAAERASVVLDLLRRLGHLLEPSDSDTRTTLRARVLLQPLPRLDPPAGDLFRRHHLPQRLDQAPGVLSSLPARSPDRRVLVVLRGLPGSGKSTVAQAIVDSDPARWARVSKDDIRQMMVGPSGDLFRFVEDRAREMVVAKTAEEMTMSALRLGLDVVVDATNLTNRALNSWHLAAMVVNRDGHGPVLVCERAVPTPVEECVARDARRGARSVGRAVIERLAATIDVPLADRNQEVG